MENREFSKDRFKKLLKRLYFILAILFLAYGLLSYWASKNGPYAMGSFLYKNCENYTDVGAKLNCELYLFKELDKLTLDAFRFTGVAILMIIAYFVIQKLYKYLFPVKTS
jgi:hypothetical protein